MAAFGFAHSALSAQAQSSGVSLAAYVLPDGTAPVICFGQEDGKDKGLSSKICDACVLISSLGVSPSDLGGSVELQYSIIVSALQPRLFVSIAVSTYVPHLRGPPIS